ncbi:MAG: alpha-ketoacid dehydrogenase subunit beta [Chloroflexi bacterium]|nr:alpha-ketoacid dehydrogenase subunit beta [Chloroflexota bacterium]
MAVKTMVQTIRDTLQREMERDPRVIVMGEDVGMGGVFRATDGLREVFGEERVIDTPLAESSIVGVAIGAALNGLRPVAEIQFADFIYPAFNQIVNEAAKMRYRSAGDFWCPLVIRVPYGGNIKGGIYHSQSIEAFFAHVPGLTVVTPAFPYDAAGLLRASLRAEDPVLYLEHKFTYNAIKGEVPDDDYLVPIGKAEVKRPGRTLSVFTYGLMLHYSLKAAETLAQEDGVEAEVVDLRTLRPLDQEAILASARKTGKVLIVHEDNKAGGLGAEVAAIIAEEGFEYLDAPIRRIAGPEVPAVPYAPPLEEAFMPSPGKILAAMRELAAY